MTSQEVSNRLHSASSQELQVALKCLLDQCAREDDAKQSRRYLHTSEIYRLLIAGLS